MDDLSPKRKAQQKRYEQTLDLILEAFLLSIFAWLIWRALQ